MVWSGFIAWVLGFVHREDLVEHAPQRWLEIREKEGPSQRLPWVASRQAALEALGFAHLGDVVEDRAGSERTVVVLYASAVCTYATIRSVLGLSRVHLRTELRDGTVVCTGSLLGPWRGGPELIQQRRGGSLADQCADHERFLSTVEAQGGARSAGGGTLADHIRLEMCEATLRSGRPAVVDPSVHPVGKVPSSVVLFNSADGAQFQLAKNLRAMVVDSVAPSLLMALAMALGVAAIVWQAGPAHVGVPIGALVVLALTIPAAQAWAHRRLTVRVSPDKIVIQRPWPWPVQVIPTDAIASVAIARRTLVITVDTPGGPVVHRVWRHGSDDDLAWFGELVRNAADNARGDAALAAVPEDAEALSRLLARRRVSEEKRR